MMGQHISRYGRSEVSLYRCPLQGSRNAVLVVFTLICFYPYLIMAESIKEPDRIQTTSDIGVGPGQSRMIPRVSIHDSASEYESDAEIFLKQITAPRSARSFDVSELVEPRSESSTARTPSPTQLQLAEPTGSQTSISKKSPRTQYLRSHEGGDVQMQMSHLVKAFRARSLQAKSLVVLPPQPPDHHNSAIARPLTPEVLAAGREEEFPKRKRNTSGASSVLSGAFPVNDAPVTIPLGRFTIPVPEFLIQKIPRPAPMDHHSYVYLSWLALLTVAFVYNAGSIPFRAAFCDHNSPYQPMWLAFDYISDLLYLIDLLVWRASVTTPVHGIEVSDRRDIIRSYVTSWDFRLDMMCLVPFDVFYFIPAVKMNPLFRWNRLLKVRSYWEFLNLVDQISTNPYYFRILRTFSYMMYIIHVNACFYYYYSYLHGFDADDDFVFNNVHPKCQGPKPGPRCNFPGSYNEYIFCLFFSVSMITIIGNLNFPGTVFSILYSALLWFVGVFIFATLVGQIRDVLKAKTRQEDEFFELMDAISEHMNTLKIPKELQDKVRSWLLFNWEQQKTTDEREILHCLPVRLRTDLAMEVHYSTIHKVHLFRNMEKQAVEELLLRLRPCVFLPGDYICRRGEIGKEMYIVKSGILEVVLPDGRAAVTLGAGSVFGEISLMAEAGGNRRTADVRAKGFSNLYILTKADLAEVLQDYPEQLNAMKTKAYDMLNKEKQPTSEQAATADTPPPVVIIHGRSKTPDMIRIALRVLNRGRKPRVTPSGIKLAEETEMVDLSARSDVPLFHSNATLMRNPVSFPTITIMQTSPGIPVSPQRRLSEPTAAHSSTATFGLIASARTRRRRSRSRSPAKEPPPGNTSSDSSSDDEGNRWLRPTSKGARRRNSSKTSLDLPPVGEVNSKGSVTVPLNQSANDHFSTSNMPPIPQILTEEPGGQKLEAMEGSNLRSSAEHPSESATIFRSPNLRYLKAIKFGRPRRISPLATPRTPGTSRQSPDGDVDTRPKPKEARRWNSGVFKLGAVPDVTVGEPPHYLSSDMEIFNVSEPEGSQDLNYITDADYDSNF